MGMEGQKMQHEMQLQREKMTGEMQLKAQGQQMDAMIKASQPPPQPRGPMQ
jgi:hypothetical protein